MGVVFLLAFIAFNLLSPADMVPDLASYRPGLVMALVNLPIAVMSRLQAPEIGRLRTQFFLMLLFCGYASCSWLPHGGFGANLVVLFTYVAPNFIIYFVALVQLRNPLGMSALRTVLVLVAAFVMANAFIQLPYVRASGETMPYVIASGPEGINELRIRGLGMLNDPNVFGQFLLLILPLMFVSKRKTGLGPGALFTIPVVVGLIVGIYFTNSRGAETGLGVLISLYILNRFKKAGLLGVAIIVPLSLVVINATRTRTVSMTGGLDRLAIWSDGMSFFKSSPLYGIGVGGFTERNGLTAHNSYLLCVSELGVIGLFLWVSMIVVTLIQLNRVSKVVAVSNPLLAKWALAVKLSLGGFLFTSFFLSTTYSSLLFLLLGLSGAIIVSAGGDDAIPLHGTNWPVRSAGLCVGIMVLIYVMLRLRVV